MNPGLLRTTFVLTVEKLSELEATSDSLCVQAKSCPNLWLLRTTFVLTVEKLSELEATSDSFCAFRRKAVRTCGCFGQLLCLPTKSCPNLRLLQTTFVLTGEKLSEPMTASDNFCDCRMGFV